MTSKRKNQSLSIILPSKNEAAGLMATLPRLRALYPDVELIVVDDGSTDNTRDICKQYNAICLSHQYSMGNGAAIKSGARSAKGDVLVFMDADGQHRPDDISKLLAKLEEGYLMVVGARTRVSQAGFHRALGNGFYNRLASWITGSRIEDLTSGFRAVHAKHFLNFLYLLPNGFSYPTTITMSFFRAGFPVAYVPIETEARHGNSHLRIAKDGIRFLIIIFKIGTLYSPLKIFVPISFGFFMLGLAYYLHTFIQSGRLTNMSALLFITSVLVFLIGLVSEQITALHYKDTEKRPDE
jgi:glycosyltransferase involved in cell wall biosynthesis